MTAKPDPWVEIVRLRALVGELLAALHHVHSCADCAENPWVACEGGRQALEAMAKAEGEL